MVFFTCNHCGESVKKPSVEKHYNTKCRGAPKNVSCMDCLKDFHAEEYVAHTKCITEAQKYSGKDYVQKEPRNSGAKKQESWMDIIRAILDSSDYKLSPQARGAFERLQSVDNVPRKKVKFQNFTKNCMHMPVRLTEEVWSVLEKEQEKMKLAKQKENAAVTKNGVDKPVQNGVKREATHEEKVDEEPAKKKSKKDKKAKTEKSQDHEDVVDENVEPTKPAKSKKSKAATIEVEAEAATNGDSEPAKKKSKKQKTTAIEVEAEAPTNGDSEPAKKKSKKQKTTAIEVEAEAPTNGDSEPAKKKSKKQKTQTEELIVAEEPVNDTTLEADGEVEYDFKWSAVLEQIARKNADGIAVEKLKKRVLKKYSTQIGGAELTAKQLKTFEKKFEKNLKKSPALLVEDGTVKAC